MRNLIYAAKAFIVGTVLGGGFGSMIGSNIVQASALGAIAALTVAWLVVARESNA